MKVKITAYSGENCTGEKLSEETIEVDPLNLDDVEKPTSGKSFKVEIDEMGESDFEIVRAWLDAHETPLLMAAE